MIAVSSKDAQSLAIVDFLHKVLDVFEDFLGSPLLTTKIEDNYEIVAQLLGEMCDGGIICNTEPNALRESVEVHSALGKLFTQVGLPGYDKMSEDELMLMLADPRPRLVRPAALCRLYGQPRHQQQDQLSHGGSPMSDTPQTSYTST